MACFPSSRRQHAAWHNVSGIAGFLCSSAHCTSMETRQWHDFFGALCSCSGRQEEGQGQEMHGLEGRHGQDSRTSHRQVGTGRAWKTL